MRNHRATLRCLTSSMVLAALASSVQAALPFIYTDTSNLLPNTPNQVVHVYVTGTDLVQGEDLNFQINTGASGPTFTSVDIITGTIFAPSNNGQNFDPSYPGGIVNSGTLAGHAAVVVATTNQNVALTVPNNGLMATLLISTDGSSGSSFVFNMLNTFNGQSNFISDTFANIAILQPHNLFSIGTPDRQWLTNGGGTWDTNANWTPFAPYAQGDIANFLGAVTAGTATVSLDGLRTVGTINFNNANASYNIVAGAGGSISLNNGVSTPSINATAGVHTIAAPIALVSNTSVSVGAASTLTLAGALSGGASALSLTGSGLLVLSGANSYGATNIGVGSNLQVGAGGNSGTMGGGGVSNSGSLAFNRNDAAIVSNGITGAGSVSQIGSGTTTLTGIASYTGPTNIVAGLLDFGGGVTHTIGTISGAGNLQVEAGTTLNSNAVTVNAWTVNGKQTLAVGSATSKVNSLVIASAGGVYSGQLDITKNKLVVEGTSSAAATAIALDLGNALASAYVNPGTGLWTGKGITSSTVANDTKNQSLAIAIGADLSAGVRTTLGIDATAVVVTRTVLGDADLSGAVGLADLAAVYNNFGSSNGKWTSGAFERNATTGQPLTVGLADLADVYNHFGASTPAVATPGVLGSGGGLGGSAAVPEPASLSLLGLASMLLLRRKQRQAKA